MFHSKSDCFSRDCLTIESAVVIMCATDGIHEKKKQRLYFYCKTNKMYQGIEFI